MENASNFRLVLVSTNSYDNAQHIARILVSERLAACCTIVLGAYSVYGWLGSINESLEVLMLIKTSSEKLEELEQRVQQLHSYDVPEILSFTMESGAASYLNWMSDTMSLPRNTTREAFDFLSQMKDDQSL
jgi:periplasmic divalent cation tolerance protein